MPAKNHYRVVILGSGPAGLTAAVYASRADLQPLVVEGGGGDDATDVPGGQLMLTTDVDNYPGFPEGIMGPELMERMRKQAARFGTEFATGELKRIALSERPFRLTLDGSEVTADTVIVAWRSSIRAEKLPAVAGAQPFAASAHAATATVLAVSRQSSRMRSGCIAGKSKRGAL